MAKKQAKDFMNTNKILLVIAIATSIVCACEKDNNSIQNQDFFPPIVVDFYVNLSLPDAAALQFNGGWIYRNGVGYRGIIIYRNFDNFLAFDRTCPYKTDSSCSFVSVDSSNIFMRCGQYNPNFNLCCASEFYLLEGSVKKGPANRPLKQYYVRESGGQIRVTSFPQ